MAIASPTEISVELPKESTLSAVHPANKNDEINTAKLKDIAQVNVRVEGVDDANAELGNVNFQLGTVGSDAAPDGTLSTDAAPEQSQRPTVNVRTPALPSVRPQITPKADLDLGPARVTFPNRSVPNSVTPTPVTPTPTAPANAAPHSAGPGTLPTGTVPTGVTAQPQHSNVINPSVGAAAGQPGVGGAAVVPAYGAPAVINLTTFQPSAAGFAPTATFGGATQAAAPSNIQLVCTPGALNAQRPGGVAQASQPVSPGVASVAGVNGNVPGGVAGGVAQQTVGSVLNGGAVRRPGLFGGLIPNPTVGVDVGPVTLDVPIPISALFNLGRGRNGNQANQTNPAGVVPAVNNPVNGAPVTTAAAAAAAATAQPGAIANNPYVPPMAYPVANVGGPYGGTMPVMTQVVTSQHTIINLTTLQPAANPVGNRTTNVGLNTAADTPAVQASTVQLVCNPGVN